MRSALKLILLQGGGFSLAAFMAGQSGGFWEDFSSASRLFQGTDEATPVTAFGDVIGRVNDRRTGPNSPQNATQATGSLKPKFQATGAQFDGLDDVLQTGYAAASGANFIVAKVTVPASIAATQVIAGASSTPSFFLSLTTAGRVSAGVGSQGTATLVGGADLRGREAIVGLSVNGSTVRLFSDGAEVYSAAQVGLPTVASFYLGARNANGSAVSFFGGSIKSVVAGRQFIDLATFNQIASVL